MREGRGGRGEEREGEEGEGKEERQINKSWKFGEDEKEKGSMWKRRVRMEV